MPRPQIKKRICKEPLYSSFSPTEKKEIREEISLSYDEYETIRLIDLEGTSREECAKRMNIARTTAQEIYNSARYKLARCLVDGLDLHIEGGSFTLCDGSVNCPHCCHNKKTKDSILNINYINKEDNLMRIAVTYENEMIFQHFGRTEQFKIFDVEGKEIKKSEVYSSNGIGHGALATLLADNKVDVLICGGLGGGALSALANAGIEVISGAQGDVTNAVSSYLKGELVSTGSNCNHHHEEGHSCSEHGCGSHSHRD